MIADVREQLERVPFEPFSIRRSDGDEYAVPAVDQACVTPRGDRVVVIADNGAVAFPGPFPVDGLIQQANAA
jgi:hypothetical protein